ncbi:MAG: hypothetical protein AABZ13_04160, partial [Planctomycetota bacterium]
SLPYWRLFAFVFSEKNKQTCKWYYFTAFEFGCGQRPRQEICGFNVFIRSELVKSDFPRAYYDKYL